MTNVSQASRAEVFGQVFVLYQHLSRRANAELEPLGLTTSQWLLLVVVAHHPDGAPTLTGAAAIYGTSRQNVKQVARQLVERGYLALESDPGDGRALRMHATEKVAATFDGADARVHERRLFEALFQGLDEADVDTLGRLLRTWLSTLIDTGSTP
jgi:DNA-binding MarR family transcriptional regulator